MGAKDVSIMSLQDEHWRRVYAVCECYCFTKYNRMRSQNKQTNCKHNRRNSYRLQLSQQVSLYYIKDYLKRWYRIRHWIPMFFGTPFSIRKQIGRQHKDLLQRRGIYFFEELIQMIFKDLGKHGKFYTKLASLFTL